MRRSKRPLDCVTVTTTEHVNTVNGYKTVKTTTTHHKRGLLDALIDLFS